MYKVIYIIYINRSLTLKVTQLKKIKFFRKKDKLFFDLTINYY